MGAVYAKVTDITALGIPLTVQQKSAAEELLKTASSKLRLHGKRVGMDIDKMCSADSDFSEAVKSVVVQAVVRAVNSISNVNMSATQSSETIGSYSYSMVYANAGQSLYFLRNELKELGLKRQTYGAVEIYGTE
ncbi:MAG: phage Gp19/Gp15/Gp42 family protein [archaeon]|nr:phage Gp19/Gp15/Gp42 family protein [archaeon]